MRTSTPAKTGAEEKRRARLGDQTRHQSREVVTRRLRDASLTGGAFAKAFEAGEIKQMCTERHEFGEGAGNVVTQIQDNAGVSFMGLR